MLDERMPPYDLEAEKAVVGSVLIDGDCIHEIENLSSEDFFTEQNRIVFKAMLELGQGINQITVARHLAEQEKLEGIGGVAYLSHLVAEVPTSLHVEYYGRIVKNLAIRRHLITAGNQIANLGYSEEDPFNAFDKSTTILNKLTSTTTRVKILTPHDVISRNMERYEMLRVKHAGLRTGMLNYDDKMGGLLPGEYTVIAGPSTVGKTTFARQWARNIGASHYVLWFALEMLPENLEDKDVAAFSGVSVKDIVRGRYEPETYSKMLDTFNTIEKLNIYTVSGSLTTRDIRSNMRQMLATTGLSVVFVDYIQLLADKVGDGNNNVRVGYIGKTLENLAKEFRVPIVAMSSLSRAPEKRVNKRPIMSDLRDSGDLEYSADTIFFLHSPALLDPSKEKTRYITEGIVAKNRLRGPLGRIFFRWNPKYETNEPVRKVGKDDYANYESEQPGFTEGDTEGDTGSDE